MVLLELQLKCIISDVKMTYAEAHDILGHMGEEATRKAAKPSFGKLLVQLQCVSIVQWEKQNNSPYHKCHLQSH